MHVIGIDFSIRYPGICIFKNLKNFNWIGIVNNKVTKKVQSIYDDINNKSDINVLRTSLDKPYQNEDIYYKQERGKIYDQIEVVNKTLTSINDYLQDDNTVVAIEGLSYNSTGSSKFELAGAAFYLKAKLVEKIGLERIFIFSPGELKKAIGAKGNASKTDVHQKFIEDPIIDSVKDTNFYQFLNSSQCYHHNGNIISPFEDMIDAYLCVLKIRNILFDET